MMLDDSRPDPGTTVRVMTHDGVGYVGTVDGYTHNAETDATEVVLDGAFRYDGISPDSYRPWQRYGDPEEVGDAALTELPSIDARDRTDLPTVKYMEPIEDEVREFDWQYRFLHDDGTEQATFDLFDEPAAS